MYYKKEKRIKSKVLISSTRFKKINFILSIFIDFRDGERRNIDLLFYPFIDWLLHVYWRITPIALAVTKGEGGEDKGEKKGKGKWSSRNMYKGPMDKAKGVKNWGWKMGVGGWGKMVAVKWRQLYLNNNEEKNYDLGVLGQYSNQLSYTARTRKRNFQ